MWGDYRERSGHICGTGGCPEHRKGKIATDPWDSLKGQKVMLTCPRRTISGRDRAPHPVLFMRPPAPIHFVLRPVPVHLVVFS